MFYWKSVNLIGSSTVFCSLIEHNRALVALIMIHDFLQVHKIVGFVLD